MLDERQTVSFAMTCIFYTVADSSPLARAIVDVSLIFIFKEGAGGAQEVLNTSSYVADYESFEATDLPLSC